MYKSRSYGGGLNMPETYKKLPEKKCISKMISYLADKHPEWKHDKVIAVAHSECGASKPKNDILSREEAEEIIHISRSKSKKRGGHMITNEQKKLVKQIYGTGDFIEVDDQIYYKTEDGSAYRVDFDTKQTLQKKQTKKTDGVLNADLVSSQPIKKVEDNEGRTSKREDLTMEQYEEHYYPETKHTETDGSHAMLEARVAKLMEAKGISREDALEQVKKRMTKEGKPVINTEDTEDMDKKEKEKKEIDDEEEEEEEKESKEKDMTELEELKKLKQQNEKLKQNLLEAEKEKKEMKQDFQETLDFVEVIKKERAAEKEAKRQDKIDQLVKDFVGLTREELEKDTMEDLEKTERRLTAAIRKDTDMDEEPNQAEIEQHMDLINAKAKELEDRYRLKV